MEPIYRGHLPFIKKGDFALIELPKGSLILLREYYDNFVILSVLAQVIIDGCKREYEIDGEEEIEED